MGIAKLLRRTLALGVLLTGLGCVPGRPLETVTIFGSPVTTQTVAGRASDRAGLPCIVVGGLSDCPAAPAAGRVRVGFVYAYDCTDIVVKDCWRWQSCEARGFVRFDLSALKGKEVISATLRYAVLGTSPGASRASCGVSLFVAKSGSASLETPGELVTGDLPDAPSPAGSISVPVSGPVRDWVLGKVENFGFFIDGPAFARARRDGCDAVGESCDSVLGDFSLRVEYADP
jgi:hypothetical protein